MRIHIIGWLLELFNNLLLQWGGTVYGELVTLPITYTDKYTILMTYTCALWTAKFDILA